MILYQCDVHDQDFRKEGCETCARILKRIAENEEVNRRAPKLKKRKSWVYWPPRSKQVDGGRLVENLTPKPVVVRSRDEMRELLRATNSVEVG